jgi:tetratricopeptide (TPR) repeat protein
MANDSPSIHASTSPTQIGSVLNNLKSVEFQKSTLSTMANDSPSIHASTSPPQVGSVVRAKLIDHPKATRRALVATVQDERTRTICVLWEDEAPRIRRGADNKPLHRSFLVTPVLKDAADEVESDIAVEEIMQLLPFETDYVEETDSANDDKDLRQKMQTWKEHGDQLLRLGDTTAAAEYYEAALGISRNVQIGSSIILKVGGHTKIAEVDCMDADEMDVEIETGEEKTIPQSEALIAILEPDSDRLQERILLNLARCMLQLAEVTTLLLQRRPLYLRGAVLACTLAISVTCFHNNADADADADFVSPTHKSALLLRSQAQAKLSKYPHAKADLKQLLVLDPQHREGLKRLHNLEKQQIQKQKRDKRLAKDICQWVGTATEDTVSHPLDSNSDETIAAPSLTSTTTVTTETNQSITSFSSWFWVFLILLVALIIQKALPGFW